ncbi:hypothetical protein ACJ41O_013238 [Fusarium nematophilum]
MLISSKKVSSLALAILALGSTDASPLNIRTPDLTKTCTEVSPPEGIKCGAEGSLLDNSHLINNNAATVTQQECIESCASTEGCTSFVYDRNLRCLLFSGDFSTFGYTQDKTGSYYSQMECFECKGTDGDSNESPWKDEQHDGETLLDIDFEDGSVDDWDINDSIGTSYEIRDVDTPFGQTKSLVITEPAQAGYTFLDSTRAFQLDKDHYWYKVGFTAKCSLVSQFGVTDWSPIRVVLWNNGAKIFSTQPINGEALANGWIRFEEEFENEEQLGGDTTISIGVEAKGLEPDWYFDNIWVSKWD